MIIKSPDSARICIYIYLYRDAISTAPRKIVQYPYTHNSDSNHSYDVVLCSIVLASKHH